MGFSLFLGRQRVAGVLIVTTGTETSVMDAVGPEQLARLLDGHGDALVLFARQWCDMPEDVVQEALVKLTRQKSMPDNAVGWLYRVVRNGAISASRSAIRRTRHESEAARCRKVWFDGTAGIGLDAAAATECLADLCIEQREAIVARVWGGLSFDEIARLTESSKSTVHRNYQAGLVELRERMGVACPEKK